MVDLNEVVSFCDQRVRREEIVDFEGAGNGLQLENRGAVSKVGAAVDAGLEPFREAIRQGVDFLIVHHGMYWNPPLPLVGLAMVKVRTALEGNLAVYGSHLPLDCHPEIGNNALLAQAIGLRVERTFLSYEGVDIGLIAEGGVERRELRSRLTATFGERVRAIEFGSDCPQRIAILTGSGRSALPALAAAGADTLITGELRQEHFNLAQENNWNLYACGHYATETFGVQALAREVGERFDLPVSFIGFDCPL